MSFALLLAGGVAAAATFSNISTITINDAPFSGGPGLATPYPSTIEVSGVSPATIQDVNLTLKGFSHTYPGDVDVLVVGPQGQDTYVMGDAGGGHPGVSGIDLTFDDEATGSVPADPSQLTTGSYKPTQGIVSTFDGNFPADAPAKPYGSQLSVFDGTDPNGTWKLYVIDGAYQDSGAITNGWSLDITPTPDTTGPTVTIIDPSAKARGVDPTADVTATFSEDLLNTSITDQTFQLFKKGSTTPLGASVTYDAATDVATLDPTPSRAEPPTRRL